MHENEVGFGAGIRPPTFALDSLGYKTDRTIEKQFWRPPESKITEEV